MRNREGTVNLDLDVQYAASHAGELPARDMIETWVKAALEGRREEAQLVVRIVDEEESRQLNERYRHRRGPTNVLSFAFEKPELLDPPLLGDVVICAPLVEAEAREQGKPLLAHWAHLVVHGVLHLLGYDHEKDDEARTMEALETSILAKLGYPDPYAGDGQEQGPSPDPGLHPDPGVRQKTDER